MKAVLIVLLALVACVLCTGPHLIAQKSIVGDAVENRNMTLEIRLWNLGQGYIVFLSCRVCVLLLNSFVAMPTMSTFRTTLGVSSLRSWRAAPVLSSRKLHRMNVFRSRRIIISLCHQV